MEYKEYYQYPTCACLNLTDSCNLKCIYCFVQQKPHFMTLPIAKNGVDWIVNNKHKKDVLGAEVTGYGITYFGGEPTLMWDDIIQPLTAYIKDKYSDENIKLSITTNGTLLDEKRIRFLYDNNIFPLLSIDGDAVIQDINRPCKNDNQSSFGLIEKNIPLLTQAFPGITFRSTVDPATCAEIFEHSFLYAEQMGFNHIFLCPNARAQWTEENLQKLHESLNKIWAYVLLSFTNNRKPINCNWVENGLKDMLEHDQQIHYNYYAPIEQSRSVERCGLGTTSISINYKGQLFSCQEQDSRDSGDFFYIGDIYNGIQRDLHLKILEEYNQKARLVCQDLDICNESCKMRSTCWNKICPSSAYDIFHNMFIRNKVNCFVDKWNLDLAVLINNILVEQNNKTYEKYINSLFRKKGE